MYEQSSDSNYEIESVLNDKIIDGKLYFFVKWKGYPHSQNSWEPQQHLKNVPEHLLAWKQMKNKLRKLDKVSKRKKDEESFDGKKYIKKNRPPGPMTGDNKQVYQVHRKSKRIKEKDDAFQGRLAKDFDFQKDSEKTSQNQEGDKNSQTNSQKSRNSLFSVLSQINKINKKREKQQSNQRKSFLEDQRYSKPSQNEKQNKKRGRPKKGEKTARKQQFIETGLKKCSKQKNQHLILQKSHKNNNYNQKERQFQHSQDQDMLGKNSQSKPQICNQILHHSKDNIQRSRFASKNVNNSFEKKKKKTITQLSNNGQNKKYHDVKSSEKKDLQTRKQTQTKAKNPFWIESSLSLFEQKQFFPQNDKNAAVFDELQQIALSNSKRMPNFLDMYGLKSNNYFTENKKRSTQIPDSQIQKQPNNRFFIQPSNELNISGIEVSSENDADDSLILIEEEDFMKGVKGNIPGKKIFLNEEYQEVSINVDTIQNTQIQPINHSKAQHFSRFQPLPDPRYLHRAKIAGQNLYDFLYQNPSLRRFKQKPMEYINALKRRTRQEIKKKGICIDLDELEKREIQRNWCFQKQIDECEEVWVMEEKEVKQVVKQGDATNVDPYVPKSHLLQTSQSQKQVSQSTLPSQQSGDIELLAGLESDILDLFMQRYPLQPITFQIKQEISRIVRKIAYENMEMDRGLRMIEEWVEGCHVEMRNTGASEKSKEQEIQEERQIQIQKEKDEKNINNLLGAGSNIISDNSEQGEIIFSPPEGSLSASVNPITQLIPQTTKIPNSPPQAIVPSSPHGSLPKPTQIIEESFIVKIVAQFYYKNQKCFKLLLKNNQQVNIHYLELKKNCPKILFQYYEAKCQQFQQKQQQIAKQKCFF